MNSSHSPWPLFSNDLPLARQWLQPQLAAMPPNIRTGHVALNLGMYGEIRTILNQQQPLEAGAAAQWRFRLARHDGLANPYCHLVPPAWQERAAGAIARAMDHGTTLLVALNGGLGDHLEALSLVLPWAQQNQVHLKFSASQERQRQFAALGWRQGPLKWSEDPAVPAMAIRHWLFNQSPGPAYGSWIEPTATEQLGKRPRSMGLLCCWRAAGAGDRLSAHSRSVPFQLVRQFYKHTLARQPGLSITDISLWQAWEQQQLSGLGVQLKNPQQGGLQQLSALIHANQVLTIDTALAHLCVALGETGIVLLPLFCDERWQELMQPHNSYAKLLSIKRSTQFGSWDELLAGLDCSKFS
ncbi:hypothetical protein [Cyanobium sp. WAJ14-Wanaka]|uniref:hypothetical protein n=1 Tax=Cyanobium sp. WAJ14-Wanaka TaxID=2823725 RepID=UPI0020CD2AC5|nr:hypothetical protein [Cyanobium sp. WAJ14-Wanaka]MCP9775637.1 hypothetical protein [Cyanobium sp. WAJ14-Wanaka]